MKLETLYLAEATDWKKVARTAAIATGIGLGTFANFYPKKHNEQSTPPSITRPVEKSKPEAKKVEDKPQDENPQAEKIESTKIAKNYKPFADNLIQYEGFRRGVYKDGKGFKTIGIGHWLKPESRQIFKKLFGTSEAAYNSIVSGRIRLTDDQVYKLFYEYDLAEHIGRAKRRLPKFETYPIYVQVALVNAVYRGDLGPNTAAFINSGNWIAAANEYIRHRDYNSKNPGLKGVTPRMDKNRAAMLQYAKELRQ